MFVIFDWKYQSLAREEYHDGVTNEWVIVTFPSEVNAEDWARKYLRRAFTVLEVPPRLKLFSQRPYEDYSHAP